MSAVSSRRRLPAEGRFAQVEDLYRLAAAEVERTEVWTGGEPGGLNGWRPLASLLPESSRMATLAHAPSTLVVVVRTVEP